MVTLIIVFILFDYETINTITYGELIYDSFSSLDAVLILKLIIKSNYKLNGIYETTKNVVVINPFNASVGFYHIVKSSNDFN